MNSEDAIVQAIGILSESMRETMRTYQDETPIGKELFHLSMTQLHYLHAIAELQEPSITELAEKFGVQKSTVTITLNRLRQKGLILKTPSAGDHRVVHIHLTEKAQLILKLEDEGYQHFACKITRKLCPEERIILGRLLNKLLAL